MPRTDQAEQKYQRAMELARAGRNQHALECLREYLLARPHDARALNDAGAVLYALGRLDEAAHHLRQAVDLLGFADDAPVRNLIEVYLADARARDAVALLDDLQRGGALGGDLAGHVAMALIQHGNVPWGIEALLRCLQLEPDQDRLQDLYRQVRSLRLRIALIQDGPAPSAAEDVYPWLHSRFETRRTTGGEDAAVLRELLAWCDLAWFEGCGPRLAAATHTDQAGRVLCRLGPGDAMGPWPARVDWARVDAALTWAGTSLLASLRRTVRGLADTPCVALPPAIDTSALPPADRPAGKRLACVDDANGTENLALVLQCFHKLRAIDGEYHLSIAGRQAPAMRSHHIAGMIDRIRLADAVSLDAVGEDLGAWLADKHFVMSCPLQEGCPAYVLEGMARGLRPIVHAFDGCEDLLGQEYCFRTIDEFCHLILTSPWRPDAMRALVAQRFDPARRDGLLRDLLADWDEQAVAERRGDWPVGKSLLGPSHRPHWRGRQADVEDPAGPPREGRP